MWTVGLLVLCYAIAIPTDDIGIVTEFFGPTTNSMIGFFLCILFYFKFDEKAPDF